jgi:hypothetical protein
MRVALTTWNGRISPVFDTSSTLRVYCGENELDETGVDISLPSDPLEKVRVIAEEADIVICGAVSGLLEHELAERGVIVHSWIMGDVKEILERWRYGSIAEYERNMPGCGRRRRGHRGCRGGDCSGT